jgi:hypothetical protein
MILREVWVRKLTCVVDPGIAISGKVRQDKVTKVSACVLLVNSTHDV